MANKKNNALIAEFMGCRKGRNLGSITVYSGIKVTPIGSPQTKAIIALQYDESWDWLMPVVEKINDLVGAEEEKPFWDAPNNQELQEMIDELFDAITSVEIHWAVRVVVKIIEWYNKEKENESTSS